MRKLVVFCSAVLLLSSCDKTSADSSDELFISSASSLTDVMQQVETEFERKHPEVDLVFNFGSSSKLRNQIQQGAPVDVFLSASAQDMKILEEEGAMKDGSVQSFAANRLVLASSGPLDEGVELSSQIKNSEDIIAIGEPESVPLGFYTKQSLEQLGIWESLDGRMIYAKDARQVLSYLESGNAGMGILYASDAIGSDRLDTVIDIPVGNEQIVYPAGILAETKKSKAAEAFLTFLTSEHGRQLLEDFGFASNEGEDD